MTYGYLMHHGVKGMRWGVRNYQNADGSLTAAGKARYQVGTAGKIHGTDRIYSISKNTGAINTYKRGSVNSGRIYVRERNRIAYEMRNDLRKAYRSRELSKTEFKERMSKSVQAANTIVRGQLGNKSAKAVGKYAAAVGATMLAAGAITTIGAWQMANLVYGR